MTMVYLCMEQIAIAAFKATCLAVLERVRKTRKPVLVTRFGKPIAEIIPPTEAPRPPHWMGSLSAKAKITGDIVAPVSSESDWDAA
jgi:prevent-host-death family protein